MTGRADRSSTPISIGLRGPRELDNLGWDEAIDDAIAIVEWAERISEALPPDRLEVDDPVRPRPRPRLRRLDMRGQGRISRRADAGARRREAPEARRLDRREARIPAGRRFDPRLRAADASRRRDGDPDDLAAPARRADPALRQALRGDRQALAGHPRLRRHGEASARHGYSTPASSPTASRTGWR